MEKATTADRLQQIMSERNLKQVDILELCKPYCQQYNVKLAKNDLSQYISNKYAPSQEKLTILALALNVNEVWLMGYNVPAEVNALKKMELILSKECKLQEQIQSQYGQQVLNLVNDYRKLDDVDQGKIDERIEILLDQEKYSTKKESRHA